MKLSASERFKKARSKLEPDLRKAVDDAIREFMKNPRTKWLHFEKLKGSDYRTIRVNAHSHRIVLKGDRDEFTLVDVGKHDYVDRRFG